MLAFKSPDRVVVNLSEYKEDIKRSSLIISDLFKQIAELENKSISNTK